MSLTERTKPVGYLYNCGDRFWNRFEVDDFSIPITSQFPSIKTKYIFLYSSIFLRKYHRIKMYTTYLFRFKYLMIKMIKYRYSTVATEMNIWYYAYYINIIFWLSYDFKRKSYFILIEVIIGIYFNRIFVCIHIILLILYLQ